MDPGVVIVNNSRETFTTTHSGAIATCIREVIRLAGGDPPTIITRQGEGTPIDGARTIVVPGPTAPRGALRTLVGRARRRLDGWARPDQRQYARSVISALRALDPRLIVVNNDPEVAVALARAFPSAEVVHWFHNLEMAGDRFRRRFARSTIRAVAVSRYTARAVEALYQLTPMSVRHALNGASFDVAPPLPETEVPTIGFVGRVAVEKGVDVLLDACLLLARVRDDFRVQIVGDTNWGRSDGGPYLHAVDRRVERLREAGIVVDRLGHLARDDIAAAVTATDIHVVPSRWDEPCALTIIEGLALGRAVVVSATGGSPELVHEAGVLFPREDAESLADALAALLDDPPLRRDLAERARARADQLTWRRTWDVLVGSA